MSICLLIGNVWASDSKISTREIEVTATRVKKVAKEVPMSLSVMTAEEIKKVGATSVADLMKDLPGVQISSTGSAGIYRLNLRGEGGSRALVMVDGVKISEQKSMEGAPLLIDLNSVDRIEVIKGPASVLYGSEAIGGAINVITKKGGDKPIQGTISATYNSGIKGVSSSLSLYGSSNNFYYRAEGTSTNAGNRIDSDGDDIDHTEYKNRNLRFLLGYENETFDIGVEYSDYTSDNEVRTGLEDSSSFAMNMDLPEWNRKKTLLHAEYKKPLGILSNIRVDAYQQTTFKEFENNMFNTIQMGPMTQTMESLSTTENDLTTTGFNAQFDLDIADTNLMIIGFEYMDDALDVDDTKKGFGDPTFSNYTSEAKQTSKSLFIHDEQMLGDNFILSGGLRYTSTETELTKAGNPSYEKGDSDDNSTVGSISLVFTGVKDTALRLLYSRGYRTPNLQQLYMGTSHGSATPTYSNSDLDAETSDNYEFGVRYDNKQFDIDMAIFQNNAKDYITTIATTVNNSPARLYTNVDEAKTKGVELTAGYRVLDFRPYLTGTYLHRKYETSTFSTTKNGMPEVFGRAGLQYSKSFGKSFFDIDGYMRYAAKAEEESSNGDIEKTDSYKTYNIQANWSYTFENARRLIITLEGLNLNNKKYTQAMSTLEEAGRHFVFKASLDF